MQALLFLTASLLPAADDAIQKEKEKLEHAWVFVSEAEDGNKPVKPIGPVTLVLSKGKYIISIDPPKGGDTDNTGTTREWQYTIDPSKSPAAMEIMVTSGRDKGKTYHAIYKIEKDQLLICRTTSPDKPRPTEFVSKRGTLLLTLKKREQ
jgi:uncharacterized protein (TIGR03067 family)